MRHAAPVAIFAALALIGVLGAHLPGIVPLIVSRIMIFGLAAMSLDLIMGIGGLPSFGHAAPLAIGAYAVAILDVAGVRDAAVVIPAAVVAAGLFALATGAVALRTRGVNFIMITLAFAQMVYFGVGSLSDYGGDDGYTLFARTEVFGFDLLGERSIYASTFAVLLATYLLLRAITASRFGRALSAIRQNRARAQALGIDAFAIELTALVIAAMIAAVAGVLMANQAEFVSPAYAAWGRSGGLMVMVILGGLGTLHGAILGAAIVVLAEEGLGAFTQHWPLVLGPFLVLAVLFFRHGIMGARR